MFLVSVVEINTSDIMLLVQEFIENELLINFSCKLKVTKKKEEQFKFLRVIFVHDLLN